MPELPDLARVERVLSAALRDRRVVAARAGDPTVLRIMVAESFPSNLVGRALRRVERRGHFMRFAFEGDRVLVVNAMLVGRYKLLSPAEAVREKDPVALGFALVFDDGTELRYVDDKRMGKVYVVNAPDEARIPAFGELGVDVLSDAFDRERFGTLARGRRDQVRMFLMDKRALASIGNAYADEILHAAGMHPKTFMRQLSAGDLDRLYEAIGKVLRHAIDEIERRAEPIDVKVRDFLAVRGRDGQPCPRCGTTIRSVRVGGGDACFCPTCQPATRRLFVDWGRLPAMAAPDRRAQPDADPPSTENPVVPGRPRQPLAEGGPTGSKRGVPPAEGEKGRPRRRPRRSTNPRRAPSGS